MVKHVIMKEMHARRWRKEQYNWPRVIVRLSHVIC